MSTNFSVLQTSLLRWTKITSDFWLYVHIFIFIFSIQGAPKNFWTESIKYMLTFGISRWDATQRAMAAKLTRLTHKIEIQLYLVAESHNTCSSHSRQPAQKLLDTTLIKRGTEENNESFNHDIHPSGQDMNPGPLESKQKC